MKELKSFIIGMILLVLLVKFLGGQGSTVVVVVVALLQVLSVHLKAIMIGVAVPVLLLAGLLFVSPWHRDLAARLATGAFVVLVVALLADPFLAWLQGEIARYGVPLLGGRP